MMTQQHPPEVWQQAIADAFDRGFAAGQLGRLRAEEQIKEQEAKIAALLEAMRFYADPDSYVWRDDDTVPVLQDAGNTARNILARYAVDDEGGME